ncbi:hypothetical protein OIU76_014538 [Salix suchowensis]|uniref:BHLH domain-containing protein n=1 Tax=Salix suchowensis TaxID=1278906 RepID=A0ABQ9BIT2_9ROSI|nr:transcription factor FER IRON DEFICIENCY-INDUCED TRANSCRIPTION FACTOR [Salix suchowensis]KAJ6309616.1 hypothetical protein OIU76_014538 [Salix suchowensis]KAJ6344914.1 hypothetical protein OIU78_007742 [Salix suchowensis]KAJ6384775.1 hypothetical protein OIU77_028060 [Salix suchowensis]
MDRMDDPTGKPVQTSNYQFELHDFIDEANFDQYIDLIRGENESTGFDCDLINGFLADDQFGPATGDKFDCDLVSYVPPHTSSAVEQDPNWVPVALPSFDGDMGLGAEEDTDEDDSSGTTTTTTATTKKTKTDRSRTLISERRRRGRMKEKLYALRSLVPNITKMDKASIIGDAVLYVQELQKQANKLRADIASLESSSTGSDRSQGSNRNPKSSQNTDHPVRKQIIKVDVFQVEERGFYVRLVCIKGEGVAASLYRALESLTGFIVQSSNLATASEGFVLTFTLNVKEAEQDMNLPNLKLWVTGALFNQGFELLTA